MLIKSVHGSPCAGAYISNAQLRCRERDFWMHQVTCDFSHQVVIKVEAVRQGCPWLANYCAGGKHASMQGWDHLPHRGPEVTSEDVRFLGAFGYLGWLRLRHV
jgi:hypothetical protein